MPTGQQYATNVPQTYITGQIHPTDTVMSVFSSSGWPSVFPFTAILEIGTSLQEPIDVTNISGTTWTITRAIDGTVGFTHNPNATVTHGDIGRDFRESRSHIDAATSPDLTGHNVHGLTNGSTVMGTQDIQTAINKTFGPGTGFTSNVAMGSGTWSGSGSLTEAAVAFSGIPGASTSITRFAGTSNNGPPTSGTFITGDITVDDSLAAFWLCTSGGSPGTWVPLTGEIFLGANVVSGVASSTFNIPAGLPFRSIRCVWRATSTIASAAVQLQLQLNGDASSSYLFQRLEANNAAVSSANGGAAGTMMQVGTIAAASATANYYSSGSFTVQNANGQAGFITVVGDAVAFTSPTNSFAGVYSGQYLAANTAVSSLKLIPQTGNFANGTTFSFYGQL